MVQSFNLLSKDGTEKSVKPPNPQSRWDTHRLSQYTCAHKRTLGSERGQSWWQEYHVNRALIAGSPRTKKIAQKSVFINHSNPTLVRHVCPHLSSQSRHVG